jgi:hypothetical protein
MPENIKKEPQQFEVPEKKEKEPKSKVVVVYRGENPYMMRLSERLKEVGYEIDERRIPMEAGIEKEEVYKNEDLVKKIIGKIPENALIIHYKPTTSAMLELCPNYFRRIDAYEHGLIYEFKSSADIVNYYKPVVEEIRERGKIPVLVQAKLFDHFIFVRELRGSALKLEESEKSRIIEKASEMGLYPQYLKEVEEKEEKDFRDKSIIEHGEGAVLLSTVINQELNVPVITMDELNWDLNWECEYERIELKGNVIEILKERGFNKYQVVLLVDHHVYMLKGESLEKSGFPEVPIVPVCICCMGQPTYNLKERGFNCFDLKYEKNIDETFERIIQMVEKRLEKQKEKK